MDTSHNERRRAIHILAGLAAVSIWTLMVAYLLPPYAGRSPVRLLGYAAGGVLCFWLGARASRILLPLAPPSTCEPRD